MGAIPGMLGLGGGQSGTGVDGPGMPNLTTTATPQQLSAAYSNTQAGMNSQKDLLAALQGQGGLGKQGDVYGQLQGVANGTGPNPAQAQYQKNVQDLSRQQSGAISSIQGISPALAARMISQQGSAAMQNAAGQGGANLAQQQLGALGAAGNMANTMAGNQIGQTNANVSAQQNEQGLLLGAAGNQNSALVSAQGNVNSANAGLANTVMQGQQGAIGGMMSGFGALSSGGGGGGGGGGMGSMAMMAAAQGGEVVKMADGGQAFGPQSQFGQFLAGQSAQVAPAVATQPSFTPGVSSIQGGLGGMGGIKKDDKSKPGGNAPASSDAPTTMAGGAGDMAPGGSDGMMFAARGGKVPALVSPGEQWLPPKAVQQVMSGKNPLKAGERIPGKPKVAGNSYANDIVPKKLEEGGIVIPNSIMQSKDPAKGAKDFVASIIAKRRARK